MQWPAKPSTPVRFRSQPPFTIIYSLKLGILKREGILFHHQGHEDREGKQEKLRALRILRGE